MTERLADEVISLPMHAYLDEPTQDRIVAAVRQALGADRALRAFARLQVPVIVTARLIETSGKHRAAGDNRPVASRPGCADGSSRRGR